MQSLTGDKAFETSRKRKTVGGDGLAKVSPLPCFEPCGGNSRVVEHTVIKRDATIADVAEGRAGVAEGGFPGRITDRGCRGEGRGRAGRRPMMDASQCAARSETSRFRRAGISLHQIMRGCRPLTDQEIIDVTNTLTGRHQYRDRALFTLGLKSGLRISCLLSLRIEDLYDGAMLKHINIKRSTVKGKRAGFQHPLHPVAAASVQEYIEHRCFGLPGDTPLFRSDKRNPYGSYRPIGRREAWRLLKRAYKAAGLRGKMACHSTRKTFCQRVYAALKHDLIATQAAMHHSTITSTIQYLSFEEEKLEAAILSI